MTKNNNKNNTVRQLNRPEYEDTEGTPLLLNCKQIKKIEIEPTNVGQSVYTLSPQSMYMSSYNV